jgi:hypothetical protein
MRRSLYLFLHIVPSIYYKTDASQLDVRSFVLPPKYITRLYIYACTKQMRVEAPDVQHVAFDTRDLSVLSAAPGIQEGEPLRAADFTLEEAHKVLGESSFFHVTTLPS